MNHEQLAAAQALTLVTLIQGDDTDEAMNLARNADPEHAVGIILFLASVLAQIMPPEAHQAGAIAVAQLDP